MNILARYFRFKKATDVLNTLINNTITNTSQVNDFTSGSILRTLYEAISLEIESYYYLNIENIKDGVWNSIYQAFDFGRRPQTKAYGYVMINFSSPLSTPLTIPKGARATSSDTAYTQVYETLDEYTVPLGTQTTRVPVYCTIGGEFGNIPAGVLDTMTRVGNASQITNLESFQTGQEEESLSEVRVRFREYIQALQRGTVQALQYGAKTVPNISGVYVQESPGFVRLYAHDANGDLSNELQQEVQNEMIYWRPAGIPVNVLPVHKTYIDANIGIRVPNNSLKTQGLLDYTRKVVTNYLDNKSVHDDLVLSDVVQKVMDINDTGIVDTQVDLMAYPDAYLRGSMAVNPDSSIYINGHQVNPSDLAPKTRSLDENYIFSNPEDNDPDFLAPVTDDDIRPDNTSTTTVNPQPGDGGEFTTLQLAKQIDDATTTSRNMNMNLQLFSDNTGTTTTSTTTLAPGSVFTYSYTALNGDTTTVGMDSSYNVIQIILSNSNTYGELSLSINPVSSFITIVYTDSKGVQSYGSVSQGQSVTIGGLSINNGSNYVSITDPSNTLTIVNQNGKISQTYADNTSASISINQIDKTKTIMYNDGKGVVTTTVTTFDSKTVSTSIAYKNIDGTTTTVNKDANGSVVSTIITDAYGNVLTPDTTTTTSTTMPTTSTTTSTTTVQPTTKYPFTSSPATDSQQAPDSGYLPIFGRYLTQPNELIRAGNISVVFISDSTYSTITANTNNESGD